MAVTNLKGITGQLIKPCSKSHVANPTGAHRAEGSITIGHEVISLVPNQQTQMTVCPCLRWLCPPPRVAYQVAWSASFRLRWIAYRHPPQPPGRTWMHRSSTSSSDVATPAVDGCRIHRSNKGRHHRAQSELSRTLHANRWRCSPPMEHIEASSLTLDRLPTARSWVGRAIRV